MYVQVVWLKNKDGDRVDYDWNHARDGGISDYRREGYIPVRHGDVYEMLTTDPENHPLPSEFFLQIQFGVHKILAGVRAAGGLRVIFGGDPPEDQCPTDYDVKVPVFWQVLLDDALREGVLSEEQATLWGNAFIRDQVDAALAPDIESPGIETAFP
ncbi:hypothetical protein Sste5346_004550 [Sporothrix stenoceras]|uniref:Uncharacterized protein n=1 Tax=Sporothrix stenoceras TaxID=5173 RepID=A0ABR3Z8V5_9PEZI